MSATANYQTAPPTKGQRRAIVARYPYRDETGALLYEVVRFEPKGFVQRRPDGNGGWTWNLNGTRRVLYRLPELGASTDTVFVCEGEQDADRLAGLGLVATTCPQGAGKWRTEYGASLADRDVVILPDNDEPGRQHAREVAASLGSVAASVRVITLPDVPEKGDVSDWLAAGGTAEALIALLADVSPNGKHDPGGIETGATLLDDVHTFLGRFVAYPSAHAHVAHTLWIAHAHLMECWESTPRLAFLSPEPGSGKTRALEVSELIVPRPIQAVNMSAAALFRKVVDAAGLPTILFDEVDTVFGSKRTAEHNEDVRGLLNAGHRRGQYTYRCVVRGKEVDVVEYEAFCAVALAGLGDLPDTVLTRSVIVRMRRRAPGERVEPFRRRIEAKTGHALRDRLAAWAASVRQSLMDAWPTMPDGIEDRDADVWEALLAVADAAGGDWPQRARVAAVTLVTASKESTPSLGIQLLADLRTVFGDADAVFTEDVLGTLNALDEAPWAEINGGKPLNANGLGQRLKQYGVKSQSVRTGGKTAKGYRRKDLYDAWVRYLPSSPKENVTTVTNDTPPTGSGIYLCVGCNLPRSRDATPCPNCGGTDGKEL